MVFNTVISAQPYPSIQVTAQNRGCTLFFWHHPKLRFVSGRWVVNLGKCDGHVHFIAFPGEEVKFIGSSAWATDVVSV